MKAIVNTGPNKLELLEVPTPEPGPGQVRIKTSACAICATDLDMIAGWERTGFPAIPGHEWSGMVDAVGEGVDAGLLGKNCVAENVLADGGEVGFEHSGGYGEYLINQASNLQCLPDNFPMDIAALIEPLAVCVRGVNRLGENIHSPAFVIGDGPIGLITCALLSKKGIEVTLLGGRPARLNVAREYGAAITLNYHELGANLAESVTAACGRKFPTICECSGSASAVDALFGIAENDAKILILGDYADARADFKWNHLLWQELTLIASNASAGAWGRAAELAVSGEINLEKLISHRIPASDFAAGFELMRSREQSPIKIVMLW